MRYDFGLLMLVLLIVRYLVVVISRLVKSSRNTRTNYMVRIQSTFKAIYPFCFAM